MQGDEQEPDLRCGTSGTSGHLSACGHAQAGVTTKSSIRNWGVLYKSGAYALKVTCLTLGDLYSVFEIKTKGGVIHPDRCAEVSRRHSRYLKVRLVRHSNVERRRNGYAGP